MKIRYVTARRYHGIQVTYNRGQHQYLRRIGIKFDGWKLKRWNDGR